MRRLALLFLTCLQVFSHSNAQVAVDLPLQSNRYQVHPCTFGIIPPPDMLAVTAEDVIEDQDLEKPYRFGIPIEMNLDITKASQQTLLTNGGRILRYGLYAPDAQGINLNFSKFELSPYATLHLYDPTKKIVLGAFTHLNRHAGGRFATAPVFNDSLILEIYLPDATDFASVVIESAVYGYRWKDMVQDGFGQAGECNVNINCPEGAFFQNQKRAVMMILTGTNSRLCTGILLNNVREDSTPYVLTAQHCNLSTDNVFWFNYESPNCTNIDGTTTQTVSGLQIRARYSDSDFFLGEMNSAPPASYNVYYAGWTNLPDAPTEAITIHHPRSDIKKISKSWNRLTSDYWIIKGNSHWRVPFWDEGTTEDGSSGAPLFNQNGKVVGQLQGGPANCIIKGEDLFGKFSHSWNTHPQINRQLKHWLDPDNTGATELCGFDPNLPAVNYNLAVLGFKDNSTKVCGIDSLLTEVLIKNHGSQSFDSVGISIYFNNVSVHQYTHQSQVNPGAVITTTASRFAVETGHYSYRVDITGYGGTDQVPYNNTHSREINIINDPIQVELTAYTDDYGDELSWKLLSNTGVIQNRRFAYPVVTGGALYKDTLCISDGCYRFEFSDLAGDGICCNFGNGYYFLRNLQTGDTIFKNYNFNTAVDQRDFCVGDSCSITASATIIPSSPGKTNGQISIDMLSGNPPFIYSWSNDSTTKDITGLAPGIYSLLITDSLGCSDSLFFNLEIGTGSQKFNPSIVPELLIYPNPGNGNVTISGWPASVQTVVRVFDVGGRMLHSEQLISNNKEIFLNLGMLENGLYILQLSSSEFQASSRLIIRH